MGDTLSLIDGAAKRISAVRDRPYFLLCLESARPTAPSLACDLSGSAELRIGRGAARALGVAEERGAAVQQLEVADGWMSSRHARIARASSGWYVEDLGSKNGTFVNGERIGHCSLADGDLLELGSSFGFFRLASAAFDGAAQRRLPAALRSLNPELCQRLADLDRIAGSRVPVLIRGPSGSGKELVARAIHERSGRPGGCHAFNCGALAESLAESALFGHRKGAFTGAVENAPGLVRAADGGTLFLDEIGDLIPAIQVKLLRVLQEQEVLPVGDSTPSKVDVRVVAATHADLASLVKQGRFRQDLFARLAGFEIALPPLARRLEDLGEIVAALLTRLAPERHGQLRLQRAAAAALFEYPWPLNIRELEQALAVGLARAAEDEIALEHLPEKIAAPPTEAHAEPLAPEEQALRATLCELLQRYQGNITAVARELGKERVQIRRWCKRFGVDAERWRPGRS